MSPLKFARRVILALMALLILMTATVACKGAYATSQPEPPEAVVARYMDAIKRNDYATANACLTAGERNVFAISQPSGTEMDALYAQLMRKIEYAIETPATTAGSGTSTSASKSASTADSGNQTQVCVDISSLDVPQLFDHTIDALSEQFASSLVNAAPMTEDMLEETFYLKLAGALESPDSPRLAGRVRVPLILQDGEWKIEADSALYNAVTGNFFEIVARLPEWKQEG